MDLRENDPVEMYRREVAAVEPLTPQEESRLLKELRGAEAHCEFVKRRLIEHSLYLVLRIAERHAMSGVSMLDLLQEGNLGLIRAVDHFSKNHEGDFSAYAATCIEESISQAIARSGKQPEG